MRLTPTNKIIHFFYGIEIFFRKKLTCHTHFLIKRPSLSVTFCFLAPLKSAGNNLKLSFSIACKRIF